MGGNEQYLRGNSGYRVAIFFCVCDSGIGTEVMEWFSDVFHHGCEIPESLFAVSGITNQRSQFWHQKAILPPEGSGKGSLASPWLWWLAVVQHSLPQQSQGF